MVLGQASDEMSLSPGFVLFGVCSYEHYLGGSAIVGMCAMANFLASPRDVDRM